MTKKLEETKKLNRKLYPCSRKKKKQRRAGRKFGGLKEGPTPEKVSPCSL